MFTSTREFSAADWGGRKQDPLEWHVWKALSKWLFQKAQYSVWINILFPRGTGCQPDLIHTMIKSYSRLTNQASAGQLFFYTQIWIFNQNSPCQQRKGFLSSTPRIIVSFIRKYWTVQQYTPVQPCCFSCISFSYLRWVQLPLIHKVGRSTRRE